MSNNQRIGPMPLRPGTNAFYNAGVPAGAEGFVDMRQPEHRAAREAAEIQRPAAAAPGYGPGQGQSPYPQRSAENQRSIDAQNAMVPGGRMASSSDPLGPPKQFYTVDGTQYPMPPQHRV